MKGLFAVIFLLLVSPQALRCHTSTTRLVVSTLATSKQAWPKGGEHLIIWFYNQGAKTARGNGTTLRSFQNNPFSVAGIGEQAATQGCFYATARQSILSSTTVGGAAGSPVYTLRLRLVYLG